VKTLLALGCRIVIAVCAQILTALDPPAEETVRDDTWPDLRAWADPPLEPWEQELLDAAKPSSPNYCLRCGIPHSGDCLRGEDH